MDDIRVIDLPQITDPVGATLLYAVTDYLGTPVEGFIADTDLGKFIGKIGKLNITQPATTATLAIADGKTLTASNTLTLAGTDGSTLNIGTGGTLGTAAFTAATAYEVPLTFSTGLTRIGNTITATGGGGSGTVTSVGLVGTANQVTVSGTSPITGAGSFTLSVPTNAQLSVAKLTNLTGNGFVKTSASDGTLGIDTTTYATLGANTFTAAQTISGTANSLTIAGSSTGNPVTLTATGSDSDISVHIVPKGLGFTQLGPDTYGISSASIVEITRFTLSTEDYSWGLYLECYSKDAPFAQTFGITAQVGTGGGPSGAGSGLNTSAWALVGAAHHYGTGKANQLKGGDFGAITHGAGGANYAFALKAEYAGINLGAGTLDLGGGLHIDGRDNTGAITEWDGIYIQPPTTGAISTLKGILVADVSGAGANYAIYTGAGKIRFGDLTASSLVATDSSKNLISPTVSSPLTFSAGALGIQTASGSQAGSLSSTDWTTFNSKYSTGGALGTPSSGTLTNCTGLPAAGVTGTAVVQARSISTTSPLSGGGDLSADRTLSIANAAADGSTKGAAAFNATNFSASSGVINTIQDIATSSTPQFTRLGIGSAADGTAKLRVVQTANATPMILGYRQTDSAPTGAFIDLKNAAGDTSIFTVGVTGAISVGTIAIGSITGLGTGIATALAVNTGSAGAPVLFNGALGTPSSGTLTSATGLPISTGLTGAGTGVLTALAVNVGSAGAFITFNGALGTPSSGTLTSATGLPISTGVSGLGTGVATALAVNVGSAGAFVTFNGALGTPSSGTLTSCTGLPAAGVVGTAAVLGANTFTAGQTITDSATILHNSSDTVAPLLNFQKARGTGTTVIVTGDPLGTANFYGYDGSNQLLMGQITCRSTGTIASTRVPTLMEFWTATNAAPSVLTKRFTINTVGDGDFIGNSGHEIVLQQGVGISLYVSSSQRAGMRVAAFNLPSDGLLSWNSTTNLDGGALDTGMSRNAAGVVEINSSSAGTFRDLKLRSLIGTAPSQFISTGAAAVSGNATLVAGTVTVSTTAAVTASLILLTRKTSGGTIGTAITYTISNGVSFTINSDNILDTSTFSWVIVNTF